MPNSTFVISLVMPEIGALISLPFHTSLKDTFLFLIKKKTRLLIIIQRIKTPKNLHK